MTGANPSRSMEDVDGVTLNYAEIKAIATGNPMIKRKMELKMELSQLATLERLYRSSKYQLEDDALKNYPAKIESLNERILHFQQDITLRGPIGDIMATKNCRRN